MTFSLCLQTSDGTETPLTVGNRDASCTYSDTNCDFMTGIISENYVFAGFKAGLDGNMIKYLEFTQRDDCPYNDFNGVELQVSSVSVSQFDLSLNDPLQEPNIVQLWYVPYTCPAGNIVSVSPSLSSVQLGPNQDTILIESTAVSDFDDFRGAVDYTIEFTITSELTGYTSQVENTFQVRYIPTCQQAILSLSVHDGSQDISTWSTDYPLVVDTPVTLTLSPSADLTCTNFNYALTVDGDISHIVSLDTASGLVTLSSTDPSDVSLFSGGSREMKVTVSLVDYPSVSVDYTLLLTLSSPTNCLGMTMSLLLSDTQKEFFVFEAMETIDVTFTPEYTTCGAATFQLSPVNPNVQMSSDNTQIELYSNDRNDLVNNGWEIGSTAQQIVFTVQVTMIDYPSLTAFT